MSVETAILAVMVFGGTAVVMCVSFVLAMFEDEARRMVLDQRQLHYGGEVD